MSMKLRLNICKTTDRKIAYCVEIYKGRFFGYWFPYDSFAFLTEKEAQKHLEEIKSRGY